MLKPQVHQSHSINALSPLPKPFIHGTGNTFLPVQLWLSFNKTRKRTVRIGYKTPSNIKAVASVTETEKSISVKAVVTVKPSVGGLLSSISLDRGLDDISDLLGKTLLLELVSIELDPKTGLEKTTIKGYAHHQRKKDGNVEFESEFQVPADFGAIGAVIVENEHREEMYVRDIVLDGFHDGPVNVNCSSWVHSKFDNPHKRVFFSNKSYLPSQTPKGLKRLREEELVILRGNGQGQRKTSDRIYDYDVYNDIGNPDSDLNLKRPVLGSKQYPYPRRCRTGRPRCTKDPLSEKRSSSVYVPRDESFADIKGVTFSAKAVYSVLHALLPSLETAIIDSNLGFPYFTAIDSLFNEGVNLPPLEKQGFLSSLLPRLCKAIVDTSENVLRFETPQTMMRDRFFWLKDEEFSRQTLAGLNPYSIRLVTEWPLKSKLDPKIYGPAESAITAELVEQEIKGFMTVEEAIKQKKLFILDYHDLLLPYVKKVRQIKATTLYGSRAVFFLTPDNTLRPIAIELVRPPMDGKPQWKQVYQPGWDATGRWLWKVAKVHVLAHDSGYHQLVSHWLRTHCATEPYIIAANRQLSAVHPIYRLLHPHFRYTMEINALAREALINAGGIIESSFTPGKYSMEISSAAYDLQWRFDQEALPADLISRGMAVEDPSAPHGLKLTIEDYPFANDGLNLWDAIKVWVTDYVNHYYSNASLIESDKELQAWWTEIRTVGHGDKKDEPWWPALKTPQDLIGIITTIVWVTSGHHAAVNFGQYTYAGYFPNRPTIARMKMPDEDPTDKDWQFFMEKPEVVLLGTFPSQIQATKVMAVLDVLSNHSPDEEYLGEKMEPSWAEDPIIKVAFEKFTGRLKELEGLIDERNINKELKNRNGAGVLPYELLKPFSQPGVTGKGVPFSISI
ncbi:Lipoxygenase domain-containing protein/PLAT domain-containing protein [Cephalotus follicularis]|uniref:Lipoxygenase n=1 Tax=Cephalotus follicularis TaxID=3775 RepID=A0A1Q3BM23_CEPFO|nr:Lipoxygenase domain-containing protein/PLAT domain-containing protein [Cephalotus follicularis]